MTEPWIRVHANIAGKPVVWRAVETLGISQHEAIGLLVQFWGSVSQHATNGHIATLPDSQIEAWAGWGRRRGKFATFIRDNHLDDDGRVNEWDDYAGKLEDRKEKDRKRKRKSRGRHADSPQDIRDNSTHTKRNDTIRYDTEIVVDDPSVTIPPDMELTAIFLAVCANRAISERWGEQPNPLTPGSAYRLAESLKADGVGPDVARLSIYRQCRDSRLETPFRTVNYFEKGIRADWEINQARIVMATSGERPPPPAGESVRPPRRGGAVQRTIDNGIAALLTTPSPISLVPHD